MAPGPDTATAPSFASPRRLRGGCRARARRLEAERHCAAAASPRAALDLKIAMAHAARCPDLRCRRVGICQKPPLQCEKRPLADAYDWHEGWWFSMRKQELYDVTSDREFLGTYAGPEDQWIGENREIAGTLEIRM